MITHDDSGHVLVSCAANDTFTRSLLTYLYAVSDEDYDDDNAVSSSSGRTKRLSRVYSIHSVLLGIRQLAEVRN